MRAGIARIPALHPPKPLPDDELVVVRVVLGTPHPVRVAREDLHGAAQVAAVPHLHLAVASGGDQRERLVRVVVDAPVSFTDRGESVEVRKERAYR